MHIARAPMSQAKPIVHHPPKETQRAGGLSGRPSCRIYPYDQIWVLELEPVSGAGIEPLFGGDRPGALKRGRLVFPTLAAAFDYAARHGLHYRILIPPARLVNLSSRCSAGRSIRS